jgi:hypothetical protein
MASQAIPVRSSTVSWGTTSGTYTAIPEVRNVVIPETSVEYQDVTSLDSIGWREFAQTLMDGGEAAFEIVYRPATFATAEGYMAAGTKVFFKVTLPPAMGQSSGDTFEWAAFVRPVVPAGAIEGVHMLTLNFRTTGAVTHTPGAST